MTPILEIHNISKIFFIDHQRPSYLSLRDRLASPFKSQPKPEEFWALKEVSFDVMAGESIGIIGRNGAGKSTLLKILSRITPPTEGHITIRGRIASLLEVGTGFHQELTGRENIFMNGSILGMKRTEIKTRFDEIVDFSGVEKFLDTPLKNYSSGMQLRLAFAVAAHLEPEILIVDEVLAVGDSEFQKKCIGKMRSVSREGSTVIFVTHNMDALAQLCQRGIVLKDGKKVLDAPEIDRVISAYLNQGAEQNRQLAQQKEINIRNSYHTIVSFSLQDQSGQPLPNLIHYASSIWVTLSGNILQSHPGLNIGYALYNSNNTLIYWSYCNDTEESFAVLNQIGSFSLKTEIPARFLNAGEYRIELISVIHNHRWLVEPGTSQPIHFQIEGGYKNVILTPKFPWFDAS